MRMKIKDEARQQEQQKPKKATAHPQAMVNTCTDCVYVFNIINSDIRQHVKTMVYGLYPDLYSECLNQTVESVKFPSQRPIRWDPTSADSTQLVEFS